MGKFIDLTGQKYGKLTILKKSEQRTSGGRIQWECECECGNKILATGDHLRSGHTKSCGCLQKQIAREINFKDISNQRFGKLIAIANEKSNSQGAAIWKCKCDCGNIIYVRGMDLRNGHTTSCGCSISKGEEKITKILLDNGIKYTIQQTFDSCKFINTNALAKFDFYVNNEYLIEYDGKQHFDFISWNNNKDITIQERDAYKNQWCKDNNIPLIRIPYTRYNDLCIEDLLLETTKYRVV